MSKNLILSLSLFVTMICSPTVSAITADDYKLKMDSVLEAVDLSLIDSGILEGYGFSLVSPSQLDGISTENCVNSNVVQMLYSGLYDSQINGNQLPSMSQFNDDTDDDAARIVYVDYNQLDPDAESNGWIKIIDEQIILVPNSPSPFVKKRCFAVAPFNSEYPTGNVSIRFTDDHLYTNVDATITKIEVKSDEDDTYTNVPLESSWNHDFETAGKHEIYIRVTFSDGKVMTSRNQIHVQRITTPRTVNGKLSTVEFLIHETPTQSAGMIETIFLNEATNGKFIRPLIIVGDVDLSTLIGSGRTISLNDILGLEGMQATIEQLAQIFDIVYVTATNTTDDLLRQGEMFRTALQYVNSNRFTVSDDSYVVGLGTGGVVARIGMNLMERDRQDHQVRKFIAVNSPFQGLNIPIALQFMIRQFASVASQVKEYKASIDVGQVQKYADILDTPAMKQLLYYRIDDQMSMTATDRVAFQNNALVSKNPSQCETVAVAQGGGDLSTMRMRLIDFEDKMSVTDYHKLGWLAPIRCNFDIDGFTLLPASNELIYYGDVDITVKLFALIGIKKISESELSYSLNNANISLDRSGGVFIPPFEIPTVDNLANIPILNSFCLVPTASALDIDYDEYADLSLLELKEASPFDRAHSTVVSSYYGDMTDLFPYLTTELVPHIEGNTTEVLGTTTLTVANMPDVPYINYTWNFANNKFKVVSQNGASATVAPLSYEFGTSDTVSVSPSLVLPIAGIDFSQLSIPAVRITAEHIFIDGNDCISNEENRYELWAIPEDVATVNWTAAQGIDIQNNGDNSINASVENIVNDAWVEASMTSCGVTHTFRKTLNSAALDTVEVVLLKRWWSEDSHSYKYYFHINVYPEYLDIDQLDFCWDNDVEITPPPSLLHSINGLAAIETAGGGSVGNCMRITGEIIVNPDLGFPEIGVGTNSLEPEMPDPIPLDPEPMDANEAVVTMPSVDSNEVASGYVTCLISDDFEHSIKVKMHVRSSWTGVYHSAPNPVTSTLSISRKGENGEVLSPSVDAMALLYSDFALVRSVALANPTTQMNVSDLPNGTYYLNIVENGEVVDRQIVIIQH